MRDAKIEVFVSYSWEDQYTAKVCEALENKIDKGVFDLKRDRSGTEPGDRWRPAINGWLGSCDGAIIFFSEAALKSDWVYFEAAILSWRKALRPEFKLMPVLLDVEGERIRSDKFGPLNLGEIVAHTKTANQSPDELAEILLDKLGAREDWQKVDCALGKWISGIEEHLKPFGDGYINAAFEVLVEDEQTRGLFTDRKRSLAFQLLHGEQRKVEEAVLELAEARKELDTLIAFLKPNWVKPEAARYFVEATGGPETRRNLAINSRETRTAEMFVDRALCCSVKRFVVPVDSVPDIRAFKNLTVDDKEEPLVFAMVGKCLRSKLMLGEGASLFDVRERVGDERRPVFLLIKAQWGHREALRKLRKLYPKIILVLLAEGKESQLTELQKLEGLAMVRPPLEHSPDPAKDEEVLGNKYVNYLESI